MRTVDAFLQQPDPGESPDPDHRAGPRGLRVHDKPSRVTVTDSTRVCRIFLLNPVLVQSKVNDSEFTKVQQHGCDGRTGPGTSTDTRTGVRRCPTHGTAWYRSVCELRVRFTCAIKKIVMSGFGPKDLQLVQLLVQRTGTGTNLVGSGDGMN